MFVEMKGRIPCVVCGYQLEMKRFLDIRINKRSIRTTDTLAMFLFPKTCPECDQPTELAPDIYTMRPADLAKVEAYRAKRWPVSA